MKSFLILLFSLLAITIYAQDIIKVSNYTFQIGETSESFLVKNPDFQRVNSTDNQLPKDVVEYNFEIADKETYFSVRFFNNYLYYVSIIDPYWSGIFADFNPLNYGFVKTGEEIESSGNQFKADYLTEFFKKGDIILKFSGSRMGFLEIEKAINN